MNRQTLSYDLQHYINGAACRITELQSIYKLDGETFTTEIQKASEAIDRFANNTPIAEMPDSAVYAQYRGVFLTAKSRLEKMKFPEDVEEAGRILSSLRLIILTPNDG